MRFRVLWILLPLLAGCAATASRNQEFDPAECGAFATEGDAVISGQAGVVASSFEHSLALGRRVEVHLDPVTAYSTEWYECQVLGGEQLDPPEEGFLAHRRTVEANNFGRFDHENVGPGTYYITAVVQVPLTQDLESHGEAGEIPTGPVHVHAKVEVAPGQKLEGVAVTR